MNLLQSNRSLRLIACLAFVFGAFWSVYDAGAYQIRDGNTLRVMQSGNPGTSGSFTVNSIMRIEGNGVIVSNNEGAIDPNVPVPVISSGGGGGPTKNNVIHVCDVQTDKCVFMFPSGNDQAYLSYENCLSSSSNRPYECAEDWAIGKGLLPYEEYLAGKASVEFKSSAPEISENETLPVPESTQEVVEVLHPEPVIEAVVETALENPPEVDERIVVDLETGEPIVNNLANAPMIVPTGGEKMVFDIETGDLVFPSMDLKSSAPATLSPREPDSSIAREYYSCVSVPGFLIQSELWKWIAYRLLIVLILLVIIIFLLAFWVYLIWRRTGASKESHLKKSTIKKKTKL